MNADDNCILFAKTGKFFPPTQLHRQKSPTSLWGTPMHTDAIKTRYDFETPETSSVHVHYSTTRQFVRGIVYVYEYVYILCCMYLQCFDAGARDAVPQFGVIFLGHAHKVRTVTTEGHSLHPATVTWSSKRDTSQQTERHHLSLAQLIVTITATKLIASCLLRN